MTSKIRTTIYIERETAKTAKEIGINISQFCEKALKEAIRRLKEPGFPPISQNNPSSIPLSTKKIGEKKVVGRAGIEPATAATSRRCHTTRPPAPNTVGYRAPTVYMLRP